MRKDRYISIIMGLCAIPALISAYYFLYGAWSMSIRGSNYSGALQGGIATLVASLLIFSCSISYWRKIGTWKTRRGEDVKPSFTWVMLGLIVGYALLQVLLWTVL